MVHEHNMLSDWNDLKYELLPDEPRKYRSRAEPKPKGFSLRSLTTKGCMVAFWSFIGHVWPLTLAPPYQDTFVMEKQSWQAKEVVMYENTTTKNVARGTCRLKTQTHIFVIENQKRHIQEISFCTFFVTFFFWDKNKNSFMLCKFEPYSRLFGGLPSGQLSGTQQDFGNCVFERFSESKQSRHMTGSYSSGDRLTSPSTPTVKCLWELSRGKVQYVPVLLNT